VHETVRKIKVSIVHDEQQWINKKIVEPSVVGNIIIPGCMWAIFGLPINSSTIKPKMAMVKKE